MSCALLPAPRNTVVGEVSDVPSRTRERQMLDLLREAIRRTVGSQKAAAIALHGTPTRGPYLCRQLAGLEPVKLSQLARAPEILAEWSALLAKANGHRLSRRLPPDARRRVIAMRRHAVEIARLELEDALAEDEISGSLSTLAG